MAGTVAIMAEVDKKLTSGNVAGTSTSPPPSTPPIPPKPIDWKQIVWFLYWTAAIVAVLLGMWGVKYSIDRQLRLQELTTSCQELSNHLYELKRLCSDAICLCEGSNDHTKEALDEWLRDPFNELACKLEKLMGDYNQINTMRQQLSMTELILELEGIKTRGNDLVSDLGKSYRVTDEMLEACVSALTVVEQLESELKTVAELINQPDVSAETRARLARCQQKLSTLAPNGELPRQADWIRVDAELGKCLEEAKELPSAIDEDKQFAEKARREGPELMTALREQFKDSLPEELTTSSSSKAQQEISKARKAYSLAVERSMACQRAGGEIDWPLVYPLLLSSQSHHEDVQRAHVHQQRSDSYRYSSSRHGSSSSSSRSSSSFGGFGGGSFGGGGGRSGGW